MSGDRNWEGDLIDQRYCTCICFHVDSIKNVRSLENDNVLMGIQIFARIFCEFRAIRLGYFCKI